MSGHRAPRRVQRVSAGSGESGYATLLQRIGARTARITVIGLGHVGLPTAVIFADAGFRVVGVDTNERYLEAIHAGTAEVGELEILDRLAAALRAGAMTVAADIREVAAGTDVAIICVQTPVTESREPDLAYLRSACAGIGDVLAPGQLVILESSVPPGTTDAVVRPMLEGRSGLGAGQDFWIAHCPERLAPGNGLAEIVQTTKLVGGIDRSSTDAAAALFGAVMKGDIVATTALHAEVSKLAENTFRSVNIALANELALLCEQIGADVMDVIRLANSHPRVSVHQPGPGIGGPCIPKDPELLIHIAEQAGLSFGLVRAAQAANEQMPLHVLDLVRAAVKPTGARNGRPKIAVLGTAYKAGVASARFSPAEHVIKGLQGWGADVAVHDPHSDEAFGARKTETVEAAVDGADAVVILTGHEEYRRMDLASLAGQMKPGASVIDTRRIWDPAAVRRVGLSYVGIGWPQPREAPAHTATRGPAGASTRRVRGRDVSGERGRPIA